MSLLNFLVLLLVLLIRTNFVLAADLFPRNSFIIPQDLISIPQNIQIAFLNYEKVSKKYRLFDKNNEIIFKQFVMEPWKENRTKNDVIKRNFLAFEAIDRCYNQAYQLYSKATIIALNQNAENFEMINKPAIMTTSTNLRGIPSELPCFHPEKPGGEYQFDDLQYSRMYLGFPVYVTAISYDKEWYFISTNEGSSGWVKAETLAFMKEKDINFFQKTPLNLIIRDDGKFKIGMFFPQESNVNQKTIVVPKIGNNKYVKWHKEIIEQNTVSNFPQYLHKETVFSVLSNLLNKPYGWGGIYGERDCSALIRDYFTSLGIYLPRNSRAQAYFKNYSENFSFDGFESNKKIAFIKKYGVPFRTILYMPGHIMLYIGEYKNQIIVLHNIWAQRTNFNGQEGRNILGKSIISSLNLGREISIIDKNLLNELTIMKIF